MKAAPTPCLRSGRVGPDVPAGLRRRLAEAEQTLRAIRRGEVDAVVVANRQGRRVFTLQGAGYAYRVLIESMNEGALTLTSGAVILYANRRFADMVGCPLARVMGGSFHRFLSSEHRAAFRQFLQRASRTGTTLLIPLKTGLRSTLPVQVSLRRLPRNGFRQTIVGMVVTDLSESRRNEELMRALTARIVEVKESECSRVALDLHGNVTQMLCAILLRSQVLVSGLGESDGSTRQEVESMHAMLRQTTDTVERIVRELRPSILHELGLTAILGATGREFTRRTGVVVKRSKTWFEPRLPAETELALYRIFQEALANVEQHARARTVTVALRRVAGGFVQLAIRDDGKGFAARPRPGKGKLPDWLGLLSMRERAAYVGGTLAVDSRRGGGTCIDVRVPWRQQC